MQAHSSAQTGSGMPNRQQDTGECTKYREFWHCGKGKKPNQIKPKKTKLTKAKSQKNLNYMDKRKLGK